VVPSPDASESAGISQRDINVKMDQAKDSNRGSINEIEVKRLLLLCRDQFLLNPGNNKAVFSLLIYGTVLDWLGVR
jgi:hypothetical protein